ncbi:MAG: hypothetical protein JSS32_00805 [Verrucomicrobia bacterium]|nr:hypothetical protein [Verrucomicrobiota bacterium]
MGHFLTRISFRAVKRLILEQLLGMLAAIAMIFCIDWVSGRTPRDLKSFFWLSLLGLVIFTFHLYRIWKIHRNPNSLRIDETHLIYGTQGKKSLLIPLSIIDKVVEKKDGIGLVFKREWNDKVTILNPKLSVAQLKQMGRMKKCDLFFQFFPPAAKYAIETALDQLAHK